MITNQETIYIFSIYMCIRACVTLNVTLEYTSNDQCDEVNTIENRIYLIGNINIYWYYLIGHIDIANIDYEVINQYHWFFCMHTLLPRTGYERVCGRSAAGLYEIWIFMMKSLRQVCSRLFIILKEYAASLRQVCGRPAAESSSYWKSMRQVCSKSAADLPQTLHHTEKSMQEVCGRPAADSSSYWTSMRQVCGRPAADSSSYWKSMQQVCGRPAADSSSYWKSMRQFCSKSAASLQQVCGRPAADSSSYWKSMRQVCGKSAAKLICMWKRWLSAAGLLQICGKSAAGVCGRLISFLWERSNFQFNETKLLYKEYSELTPHVKGSLVMVLYK